MEREGYLRVKFHEMCLYSIKNGSSYTLHMHILYDVHALNVVLTVGAQRSMFSSE